MKGDYTTPGFVKPGREDEDHPQMKGDYTAGPDTPRPPADEDHPQMKGDYTLTGMHVAVARTKITPK